MIKNSDGPEGMSDDKPGRMQSIYMTSLLAAQSGICDVFVHDCHRKVEAVYSTTFLHDIYLKKVIDRLRQYHINLDLSQNSQQQRTIAENPGKEHVLSNS